MFCDDFVIVVSCCMYGESIVGLSQPKRVRAKDDSHGLPKENMFYVVVLYDFYGPPGWQWLAAAGSLLENHLFVSSWLYKFTIAFLRLRFS